MWQGLGKRQDNNDKAFVSFSLFLHFQFRTHLSQDTLPSDPGRSTAAMRGGVVSGVEKKSCRGAICLFLKEVVSSAATQRMYRESSCAEVGVEGRKEW